MIGIAVTNAGYNFVRDHANNSVNEFSIVPWWMMALLAVVLVIAILLYNIGDSE